MESSDSNESQGRRLVINIGGQKFGSQILGGKNFLKIYFKKKIFKSSLQFSEKILTTFFSLFIENVQIYFLFFVFFFLSLCFWWGARARAAPPESTPMLTLHTQGLPTHGMMAACLRDILIYSLPHISLSVSHPNTSHHSRLNVCLIDYLDLNL